jgi:hypothetical protein
MSISGEIGIHANITQVEAKDLGNAELALKWAKAWALLNGTGANQADKIYHDKISIGPSATVTLDLAGVLTDPLGVAFTLAKVKAILVFAAAANNPSNNVNVQRPASNGVPIFLAASDGIGLRPGAAFAWFSPDATGVAVTAGTGDLLDFVNSAGTNTVEAEVIVIGTSA